MKKYYEIALMQHVSGSVEDDYETVYFVAENYTYNECKKIAKEISKNIGDVNPPHVGYTFNERKKGEHYQGLDTGLACVKIVCYTENDTTSYEPIFYEYYKSGKVEHRVTFDD